MGRLSIENRLFLLHNGRQALIAPQTLAIACDQCDFIHFDPAAVEQISTLLQSPLPSKLKMRSGEVQKRLFSPTFIEPSHEIQ
jgi:hypothetical protein